MLHGNHGHYLSLHFKWEILHPVNRRGFIQLGKNPTTSFVKATTAPLFAGSAVLVILQECGHTLDAIAASVVP